MVRGPRNVSIVLTKAQPTFGFVLEFHIPFLAVREQSDLHDGRLLRKSYDLPEWLDTGRPTAKFHESQLSLLVYGPDEWLWTAYCFVDTFYGSEVSPEEYLTAHEGAADAPSGGEILLEDPIWNPREYFLFVLARRMRQVEREWSNLVAAINARLSTYVRQCWLIGNVD